MRLDKYLAEASVGTRKVVRNYVKDGKVSVNNQVITDPAMEFDENNDVVKYLEQVIIHTGKVYYMFYKPAGCISARKDANRKTVLDYFDLVNINGLFPVGRLDIDTEGLLFLTNDGEFNHQLMHPKKHVDKNYFFIAFGSLDLEDKKRLETGINIGLDEFMTKPAKIKIVKEGLYQEFKMLKEMEIDKVIYKKKIMDLQPVVSGYLTISEGRKHQVKRMLKAVGCYVVYLKRVSIGEVMLDESLQKGQYRTLTEEEIHKLIVK